jgi:hypothetical protein
MKYKGFWFGKPFATFLTLSSSHWCRVSAAERGGLHSFEFANPYAATRLSALSSGAALGIAQEKCLETEPIQV